MTEAAGAVTNYMEIYSQTGDIIVVAMCILFAVLICASFVSRTRSFRIFCAMLVMMAVAAYSNIILHVLLRTAAPHWLLTALRILHYSALFANLFLFLVYFTETIRLDRRQSRVYLVLGSVGLAVLILYMTVGALLGAGSLHDAQIRSLAWMRIFNIGYFYFVGLVAFLSFRFRGRIYRQVSAGVLASSIIAFLLLIIQMRHGQSSYTAASFLFPAVALLYLVHAKPYDLEIGAVNASGFDEHVRFCRRHNRELLLMSLLLPEFEDSGKKFPVDLQQTIRQFASSFFRGAVLFQVSGGRIILTVETNRNPNYEDILHKVLEKFEEAHAKYQLDHKIVIGTTDLAGGDGADFNYLNLIQYAEAGMPVNTVLRIRQSDVDGYQRRHRILNELADIHAAQNTDDPRVLVYCQPVLNLRTGQYDTAEALMRLQLDGLGTVPPGEFIPLAEEYGFISALSKIILSKTCGQIRRLTDEGYYVRRISVNFSMLDLRDPDFSAHVNSIIQANGIPCEKIAIELTESQNERDFMLVKERISELHESGIKFYLDDFGTGYSNFDRIMELPFDIIKFDRSLVIASGADEEKRTMVTYLAHMFNDTNYSILFEGVETETDQARCVEMYAEYLQGYKFSAPIPIERLSEYFARTPAAET